MYTTTTSSSSLFFFFFNDTATTEIYTLSLHDALPISPLEPADYASAEIFCDVHRRHLIELGIIDLLGDLLSPSVIFAVDHELITVGSTLRQHGFVDALDWDAEFRVV